MEDRSKRTEAVRPQFGEHCESQSECDSALSVKSDVNDIDLDGETDDEDMEDEETGFNDGSAQVRNIRAPHICTDVISNCLSAPFLRLSAAALLPLTLRYMVHSHVPHSLRDLLFEK